jgi:phosphoglycolate phosphatase-like HAD superfamily hydrolase
MGMSIAIVSSNARSVITEGLAQFGLSDLIDHIEADACGKVQELQRVLHVFNVAPVDAFYVDDTFEGVNAACSIGITAIGIEGGWGKPERLLQAGATWCVQSHDEISRALVERSTPAL